jgi:hypothetical protein
LRVTVGASLAAFLVAPVLGQSTDPVVAHFLEYRAAVERKDFVAAEAAATEALAASEAVNGSRTAVLAFNLATVRLSSAEPSRALEPAARAHELATTTRDTGVDALLASLTLGRAELAADVPMGVARLVAAIEEAEKRTQFLADAYAAAVTLGDWTTAHEEFEDSRAAWAAAARLAPTGSSDPDFALGRAKLGEGVAIVLSGINTPRSGPSMRNDSKSRASAAAHAADSAFTEAQRLLRRHAFPRDEPASLTPGQIVFAQAMAWQGALRARLDSQDEKLRDPVPMDGGPAVVRGAAPPCEYARIGDLPGYPAVAFNRLGAGAVVVHTLFGADGSVIRSEIAAGVPPGAFVDAIRREVGDWRYERWSGSPPNCDLSGSRYIVIRFVID